MSQLIPALAPHIAAMLGSFILGVVAEKATGGKAKAFSTSIGIYFITTAVVLAVSRL